MGSWAYCRNDECNQGFDRDEPTAEDVMNGYWNCPACGMTQDVVGYSPAELMQEMFASVKKLEEDFEAFKRAQQ